MFIGRQIFEKKKKKTDNILNNNLKLLLFCTAHMPNLVFACLVYFRVFLLQLYFCPLVSVGVFVFLLLLNDGLKHQLLPGLCF